MGIWCGSALRALHVKLQALAAVQANQYGIGAVLIDGKGNIIHRSYNKMKKNLRTDLHGEMTLMTEFETLPRFRTLRGKNIIYPKGFTVFSSAEPCPMCLTRMLGAHVNIKYVAAGAADGMVKNLNHLPLAWRKPAKDLVIEKADASPFLQDVSHLLFHSYFLD